MGFPKYLSYISVIDLKSKSPDINMTLDSSRGIFVLHGTDLYCTLCLSLIRDCFCFEVDVEITCISQTLWPQEKKKSQTSV